MKLDHRFPYCTPKELVYLNSSQNLKAHLSFANIKSQQSQNAYFSTYLLHHYMSSKVHIDNWPYFLIKLRNSHFQALILYLPPYALTQHKYPLHLFLKLVLTNPNSKPLPLPLLNFEEAFLYHSIQYPYKDRVPCSFQSPLNRHKSIRHT